MLENPADWMGTQYRPAPHHVPTQSHATHTGPSIRALNLVLHESPCSSPKRFPVPHVYAAQEQTNDTLLH